MGGAKRMMEEEEEDRGFSLSEGVSVCSDCFGDYGIAEYINRNADTDECTYCEAAGQDVSACSLDTVKSHILHCIFREWGHPSDEGLPYESREGGWQVAPVYDSWELVDQLGLDCAYTNLAEDISSSFLCKEWCERDPYSLSMDKILSFGWRDFSRFVVHEARYVFFKAENTDYDVDQHDEMNPIDILDAVGEIVNKLELLKKLESGSKLHRVRIMNADESAHSAKELGAPPNEFATFANRMSPAGISMFYGA